MSADLQALLYGVALPFVVAAVLTYLACRFAPKQPIVHVLAAAVVMALGFFLSHGMLLNWSWLQPTEPWEWLPYLVALAAFVGIWDYVLNMPWVYKLIFYGGFSLLFAWLTVPNYPSLADYHFGWVLLVGVIMFGLWTTLIPVACKFQGPLTPVVLTLVAFAAAYVVAMDVFITGGQLAGILGAIFLGAMVVCFAYRETPLVVGLIPGFVVVLPSVVVFGNVQNSNVPLSYYALLAVAPMLLGIALIPLPNRVPKKTLLWFAAFLVVAATSLAIVLVQ